MGPGGGHRSPGPGAPHRDPAQKAEQDHLELTIPDDVLRFIAEHVRSSVRELEGCIIKLLLFASLKNREVTIELAREALSDKIRQGEDASSYGAPTPSIDRVQEVVARRWGVTPEGLRSKARTKTLTIPRQVAMYLARNMLSMQLWRSDRRSGGVTTRPSSTRWTRWSGR